MINPTKLGQLITHVTPHVTYVQIGLERNPLGEVWYIKLTATFQKRVVQIKHAFTDTQINEMNGDPAVVGDALLDALRDESKK